jgi:hypothetical protein
VCREGLESKLLRVQANHGQKNKDKAAGGLPHFKGQVAA